MSNWALNYYRKTLTGVDVQVYDRIYLGWEKSQQGIALPLNLPNDYETNDIVTRVAMDHPEIFWVDYYSYTLQHFGMGTVNFCRTLRFNFFFDAPRQEALRQQAYAWRERICRQIPPGLSKSDQLWMLYDYLSRQVTYGEKGNAQSHTILGCFLPNNHISVCEGISKGFKFLCDGMGIPCIVVTGTALSTSRTRGGHAWNLVSVNGKYRHLDVTSELTRAKRQGIAPRDGYLHTDKEMREYHYQWNAAHVPAAY